MSGSHHAMHRLSQCIQREGFGQQGRAFWQASIAGLKFSGIARHENNRQFWSVAANVLGQLDATHPGHADVGDQ